jgi:hypothetical protein
MEFHIVSLMWNFRVITFSLKTNKFNDTQIALTGLNTTEFNSNTWLSQKVSAIKICDFCVEHC